MIYLFLETGFNFNGINSTTYNLKIVHMESGLINRTFGVSRSINKDKVKNSHRVIKTGIQEEVRVLRVTMALDHATLATRQWSTTNRMAIAEWLFVDDYKEFKSSDDTNVIYRCIPINAENFINGLNEGYTTLEFECDSPFAYSEHQVIQIATSGNTVVNCTSNITHLYKYYPTIHLLYNTTGASISLTNTTTGETFALTDMTGLPTSDNLYAYGSKKQILTANGMNVFNKWNKGWISLVKGNNTISVTTATNISAIRFNVQYPIML
jgi:phage-related protein